MQPSVYHRGLMIGDTPNIDRIAKEGAMWGSDYSQCKGTLPPLGQGVAWAPSSAE
jgi:hypothetical protein